MPISPLHKKQKAKNYALLFIFLALSVLLFVLAVLKFKPLY